MTPRLVASFVILMVAARTGSAQSDSAAVVRPDTILPALSELLTTPLATPEDSSRLLESSGTDSEKRPHLTGYTVDADAVVRWRLQQLRGGATDGFLLRSAGTMIEAIAGAEPAAFLRPTTHFAFNSGLPHSVNDGPLWAGEGANSITTWGFRLAAGPLRIVVLPQLVVSVNSESEARDTTIWWSPDPPRGRIGRAHALSWYQGRFSIDLPVRFGDGARVFLDPGQSSMYVKAGPLDLGAATENQWWGPGIRNALVLSNTAPGFVHLFLRSARPWRTGIGALEWRWLAGALDESEYFDTDPSNDARSLAAIAVTLQPRFAGGLTVGATRSVLANASGTLSGLGSWFDIFRRTGRTEAVLPWHDPATEGGREHILAVFGRYVLPGAGAELYGEWGRTALSSLRDLAIAPNHTQGYTLGMQWSRPLRTDESRLQLQAEVTTVEQSATFRDRPLDTWYASRRVLQGYTHRGEMLGAAIGPGASSQWLALDYLGSSGSVGGFVGRTRWNEDIRNAFDWPDYMPYCNHDVSMQFGVRGGRIGRVGHFTGELSVANRINAYFQVAACHPSGRRDVRNVSLRFAFIPRL